MHKSTGEILEGIKGEDRNTLSYIYEIFFPMVENFILHTRGNSFDAKDVFQDAMVIIYTQLKNDSLYLHHSFRSYIFSVSKYVWFKELKRKQFEISNNYSGLDLNGDGIDIEKEYIKMEKRKLFLDHFQKLKPECRRLIDLFINKTSISVITSIMGYSSNQYTKNRRNFCKGVLVREIWNSPRYKELKNESYRENSKVPRW